jgi:hypothetical protein
VITEEGWGRLPEIVKSAMIDANLATTGDYVRAAAERGGFSRSDIHLTRTTAELDEQGWREVAAVLEATFHRVRGIVDEAGERLSAGLHRDHIVATAVLMLFEGGDPHAAKPAGDTAPAREPKVRRRRSLPEDSRS